jgi:hypothetical protein
VGQLFGFCTARDGLDGPGAPEVGQGPAFVAAKQGMADVAEVVVQGVAGGCGRCTPRAVQIDAKAM